MLDWLIEGGTVVDGRGGAPVTADVAVQDGAIVESGTHAELVAGSQVYARLHQLSFNV